MGTDALRRRSRKPGLCTTTAQLSQGTRPLLSSETQLRTSSTADIRQKASPSSPYARHFSAVAWQILPAERQSLAAARQLSPNARQLLSAARLFSSAARLFLSDARHRLSVARPFLLKERATSSDAQLSSPDEWLFSAEASVNSLNTRAITSDDSFCSQEKPFV